MVSTKHIFLKYLKVCMWQIMILMGDVTKFAETAPTTKTLDVSDTGNFKCPPPDITLNGTRLDPRKYKTDFNKVSEVKFPGRVGPLRERMICKIKCIDGKWVGPLCSVSEDGRFQPVFRECTMSSFTPQLLITFRNETFPNNTKFTHGSIIHARCKHFGLYKLIGENSIICENGEWSARLPECVPTTAITNFTEGAPPTISLQVAFGSASVEPSGIVLVYGDSTLRFDCLAHRTASPEWTWTANTPNSQAAWSNDPEENQTHYRLELSRMVSRHSGIYTCATSGGETNSVSIIVVNVQCDPITVNKPYLQYWTEGTHVGQTIRFHCALGYRVNGSINITCMGSGTWSTSVPSCVAIHCPMLKRLNNELAVVEYNASVGGRAVFRCGFGYRLVGSPGMECDQDGKWTDKPPTCLAIHCQSPVPPENGFIIDYDPEILLYAVGSLLHFQCHEPYRPEGQCAVVCTENGFWSHPPPFCILYHERKEDIIYDGNTTLVSYDTFN